MERFCGLSGRKYRATKSVLLLCLKFAAWHSAKSLHSKHSPEKFQITFGNFQKLLAWGLEGGWSLIYVEWSWKVRGECPVKVTVHNGYILYTQQNFTGSQCSLFNSNVILLTFLLGSSGEVVNSLDFCPASLKSLGCFYFRCVLSWQWKMVTVNLQILHCQL